MSISEPSQWKKATVALPAAPVSITHDGEFGFYVSCVNHAIYWISGSRHLKLYAGKVGSPGNVDGKLRNQALLHIEDNAGGLLRLANGQLLLAQGTEHNLRLIDEGQVSTFSGSYQCEGWRDGPREQALWYYPAQAVELRGSVYIADLENKAIRVINEEGMVSTIGTRASGHNDGAFAQATFGGPFGICASLDGGMLYVSDCHQKVIRALHLESETIKTMAHTLWDDETGTSYWQPRTLHLTPGGEVLLACEGHEGGIRSWDPSTGTRGPFQLKALEYDVKAKSGVSCAGLNPTTGELAFWSAHQERLNLVSSFCKVTFGPDPELCNLAPLLKAGEDIFPLVSVRIAKTVQLVHLSILKLYNLTASDVSDTIGLLTCPLHDISSLLVEYLYGQAPVFTSSRFAHCEQLCHLSFIASLIELPIWQLHLDLQTNLTYLRPDELVRLLAIVWRYCRRSALLVEMITVQMKRTPKDHAAAKHTLEIVLEDDVDRELVGMEAKFRSEVDSARLYCPEVPQCKTSPIRKGLRAMIDMRGTKVNKRPPGEGSRVWSADTFVITIEGRPQETYVHPWVLYGSWPFFQRMIDIGMEEARTGRAELPSDFPPTLLAHILSLVYLGQTNYKTISDVDAVYALKRGGEFGLADMAGNSYPVFDMFWRHCRSSIFCRVFTVPTCIRSLVMRMEIEPDSLYTQAAMTYVARNVKAIIKADRRGWNSLSDEVQQAIVSIIERPIKGALAEQTETEQEEHI